MTTAIVCIAKNEDRYLEEFVEWHRKLGISHVFVYENNWRFKGGSIDGATLIPFDGDVMQLKAYNTWLNSSNASEYDYAAFIDVDEFIVPRDGKTLQQHLEEASHFPVVAVNWRLMGDNNLSGKAQQMWSVLKRFTMGAKKLDQHVKCIVNLQLIRNSKLDMPKFINPHFTNRMSWTASSDQFFFGPWQTKNLDKVHGLEIWHYAVKTREELHEKVMRGRADTLQTRVKEEESYFQQHNLNEIELRL